MCQRRQKSCSDCWLRKAGRSCRGSGSRAAARARSPCRCSRRSRSRSAPRSRRWPLPPLCRCARRGAPKTGSTIRVASRSASTTFLNRPPAMSERARRGDAGRIARPGQLRDEFAGTDDGPRHQVREERGINRVIHGPGERAAATVDIGYIRDRLKGVEGHADGQCDMQQLQRRTKIDHTKHLVDRADEEIEVLEYGENPDVEDDPRGDCRLSHLCSGCARGDGGGDLVDHRGRDQEDDEPPVGAAIEEIRRSENEAAPGALARHETPGHRENDGEKRGELDSREEHRLTTPVAPRQINQEGAEYGGETPCVAVPHPRRTGAAPGWALTHGNGQIMPGHADLYGSLRTSAVVSGPHGTSADLRGNSCRTVQSRGQERAGGAVPRGRRSRWACAMA